MGLPSRQDVNGKTPWRKLDANKALLFSWSWLEKHRSDPRHCWESVWQTDDEKGRKNTKLHVRSKTHTDWHQSIISTVKHSGGSIMMWACCTSHLGRGKLLPMFTKTSSRIMPDLKPTEMLWDEPQRDAPNMKQLKQFWTEEQARTPPECYAASIRRSLMKSLLTKQLQPAVSYEEKLTVSSSMVSVSSVGPMKTWGITTVCAISFNRLCLLWFKGRKPVNFKGLM